MINLDEGKIRQEPSWFLSKIKGSADPRDVQKGDIAKKDDLKKIRMFHLYNTIYKDPKTKDDLPYYDAFPLFFPLHFTKGSEGTLLAGINIHYIPPAMRVKFLKELETLIRRVAEQQKFDVNNLEDYPHQNITKVVGRYMNKVYQSGDGSAGKLMRSAYRSYFLHRMTGKMKKIPLDEWTKAGKLYLPRYRKKYASYVYRDVKKQYDRYKNNSRSDIY